MNTGFAISSQAGRPGISGRPLWPLYLLVLFAGACGLSGKPKTPAAFSRPDKKEYSVTDFGRDRESYRRCIDGQSACPGTDRMAAARAIRDRMINGIEGDIELNYREYEAKLFHGRAAAEVAADIVELGAAATTNIANGIRIKNILAASLTGFKGSRLSIDRNFFREKTTEIIISKMHAYRDQVRNRITQKMTSLSAVDYPFEEAWRDLIEHFYAGTLQGGIQALADDAGRDAANARAQTEKIEEYRAGDAPTAFAIRKAYEDLKKDAFDPDDHEKAAKALEKARNILTELGELERLGNNPTREQVFTALREYIKGSLDDRPRLLRLKKALTPEP